MSLSKKRQFAVLDFANRFIRRHFPLRAFIAPDMSNPFMGDHSFSSANAFYLHHFRHRSLLTRKPKTHGAIVSSMAARPALMVRVSRSSPRSSRTIVLVETFAASASSRTSSFRMARAARHCAGAPGRASCSLPNGYHGSISLPQHQLLLNL
jgi:hypothetical protein